MKPLGELLYKPLDHDTPLQGDTDLAQGPAEGILQWAVTAPGTVASTYTSYSYTL